MPDSWGDRDTSWRKSLCIKISCSEGQMGSLGINEAVLSYALTQPPQGYGWTIGGGHSSTARIIFELLRRSGRNSLAAPTGRKTLAFRVCKLVPGGGQQLPIRSPASQALQLSITEKDHSWYRWGLRENKRSELRARGADGHGPYVQPPKEASLEVYCEGAGSVRSYISAVIRVWDTSTNTVDTVPSRSWHFTRGEIKQTNTQYVI